MTPIKAKYSADDIAKFFLWKAEKDGKPITNKKLQKLLYYAQAWNLVFEDKPLFKEDVEAWVHGPAVRKVYLRFKRFGFAPIAITIKKEEDVKKLSKNKVLDAVWRVYGKYDAQYLEELSHNEAPWQEAREGLKINESSDNIISLESMKNFYSTKVK